MYSNNDAFLVNSYGITKAANVGGKTTIVQGIEVSGTNASGVAAALAAAQASDVVVLTIGIDHTIEHEGTGIGGIGSCSMFGCWGNLNAFDLPAFKTRSVPPNTAFIRT